MKITVVFSTDDVRKVVADAVQRNIVHAYPFEYEAPRYSGDSWKMSGKIEQEVVGRLLMHELFNVCAIQDSCWTAKTPDYRGADWVFTAIYPAEPAPDQVQNPAGFTERVEDLVTRMMDTSAMVQAFPDSAELKEASDDDNPF